MDGFTGKNCETGIEVWYNLTTILNMSNGQQSEKFIIDYQRLFLVSNIKYEIILQYVFDCIVSLCIGTIGCSY